MSPNKKQKKRLFSIDRTPDNIFVQFPPPRRNTVIIIASILFLIIVLLVASNEPTLRTKALELVISIIEAIVAFFSANSKDK